MTWRLLQNSLVVAGGSAILASIWGIVFALFAACIPKRFRSLAVVAGIVALILPPFLVTNTWLNYFGLNGTWRQYLDFDVYSLPGTILLLALLLWPIPFLFTLGSLSRINPIYFEQEPLLRGWALLRHLAWPSAASACGFAFVLTFVLALNNFSVPALLQTKVYSAEVWLSFNTKFDYGEALRLSWPLILGPLIFLWLFRFEPVRFSFRTLHTSDKLWRQHLSYLFPVLSVLSTLLVFLSLGLPLSQLLTSPRTWSEFFPAIEAGKSAVFNSVLFAFVPAVIVVACGAGLARARAAGISWLLFLAPGVLLGIALIWSLNRPALSFFYQSAGLVILAFTIRYLALGWTAARVALATVDHSARDVVSVLGGSRWKQFRLAEWPQSKRVFLGAFYVVYLLCLWEVETLILIVPPGRETLGLRIFNMLHYGHAGQVDALCVWLLALGLAPLLLFALQNVVRRKLSLALVLLVSAFTFSGCGGSVERNTPLKSKFFSSVQVFGSRGTGAGQFNKPRSIAVDGEDNFYVVDMTGRVQKFSPDGNFLLSWQMPQTDKGKPKGMACDAEGNIIVVEPHYSRANHFNTAGELVAQWGDNGTNAGQLYFPRAVAVNSHGEIFLSEYGMVERIQHFSHRGTNFIGSFGSPGTGPGELNRAEGIGAGPDDTLFVADSCNHRIQVFSADGKLVSAFGKPGSGPNELSYPYDVRVDSAGYQFVCEFGNSRVQIFDPQNQSIELLGGAGAEPGMMNNPWAIALDSHGNLLVADSLNHRVQKFYRRSPLPSVHTGVVKPGPTLATK